MPAPDYATIINEWTSLAEFRAHLGTNPTSKLVTWAANNNLDYTRVMPKNTEVRKITGVANQMQYCVLKAAEAKAKMEGKTPEPVPAPKAVKRAPPTAVSDDAFAALNARMELAVKGEKEAQKRCLEQTAEINTLTNKCVQLEAEIRKLRNELAGKRLEVEQVMMLRATPAPEPESDKAHCDDCNTIVTDLWVAGSLEIDGYDILCLNCADNRGLNDTSESEVESVHDDRKSESAVSATSDSDDSAWGSDY